MTRYYTTTSLRYCRAGGRFTIPEILNRLYILTWDAKTHKHNFTNASSEKQHRDYGWDWAGDHPFTFESLDHEAEFLDFHPDCKDLRRAYSNYHGCCIRVQIEPIDYEELPIYRKGNRWLWKK